MQNDTIRIALKKRATTCDKIQTPRLGTGGAFDGIFLWDVDFTIMCDFCGWAGLGTVAIER